MQQLTYKMVWSFSFILFHPVKKRLDFKRKSWGRSVEKCGKVPKRFCPLVVMAFSFSLILLHVFHTIFRIQS